MSSNRENNNNRDNFAGGFLLGTLVGGVIGGIIGVLLASSRQAETSPAEGQAAKGRKNLNRPTGSQIESARRGLEDKIAQLNDAIDDVRQQLGNVNGSSKEEARSVYGKGEPD